MRPDKQPLALFLPAFSPFCSLSQSGFLLLAQCSRILCDSSPTIPPRQAVWAAPAERSFLSVCLSQRFVCPSVASPAAPGSSRSAHPAFLVRQKHKSCCWRVEMFDVLARPRHRFICAPFSQPGYPRMLGARICLQSLVGPVSYLSLRLTPYMQPH